MLVVGAGEADITPPVGTPFGGFFIERESPIEAIHDPLLATATFMGDTHNSIVLVSCDLQTIDPQVVDRVRRAIHHRLSISPDAILVAATHVHSAPGGDASERQIPGLDPYFTTPAAEERIEKGIINAVLDAYEAARPATLWARTETIPGIGRSRFALDTEIASPATLFLARDAESGQELSSIVSYGCHPSVLGPDNLAASADFPGVVRKQLSAALGGIPVNFLNAPAGDISTRGTRRNQTFSEMERLGESLTKQIANLRPALSQCETTPLRALSEIIELPVNTELLPRLEDGLSREEDPNSTRARYIDFQIQRLSTLTKPTIPCEIQVLRCGDIVFSGIAAELFTTPAQKISSLTPSKFFAMVAPANGTVGNLPARDLHHLVQPLVAAGSEQIVYSAIDRLMKEVLSA